jgi:large subunit ribosomal protein L4
MEIVNQKIELPVVDYSNKEVAKISLLSSLFGVKPNEYAVQRAIKVDLANRRQATAKTRTISEVRGTGRKPWKQKGTGRARVGTHRSPLWRGGAVVFGPTGIQNFKLKMNKQEHYLALASVLSDKVASKKLTVVEAAKFDSAKTKDFAAALKTLGLNGKTLFVIDEFDDNFLRASANIQNLNVVTSDNVSVYDVLNADNVVFTKSVIDDINAQAEAEGCDCDDCKEEKEAK